jgi:Leucine-rich repeat (LRR) protein
MKNLKQLYVCENELTDIRGLEGLPNLQKLSVRNNKLRGILSPFPFLPNLTYLNLRENQIAKLDELRKIDSHVTGVNVLQNPVTDELGEGLKKEVAYLLPHLTRVNKSDLTIEERVAFEKEMLEKLAEKERERLAQEEEARKAQEEKAAE